MAKEFVTVGSPTVESKARQYIIKDLSVKEVDEVFEIASGYKEVGHSTKVLTIPEELQPTFDLRVSISRFNEEKKIAKMEYRGLWVKGHSSEWNSNGPGSILACADISDEDLVRRAVTKMERTTMAYVKRFSVRQHMLNDFVNYVLDNIGDAETTDWSVDENPDPEEVELAIDENKIRSGKVVWNADEVLP